MEKFDLLQIKQFVELKEKSFWMTAVRFENHFKHRFNHSKGQIADMYELYVKFVRNGYRVKPQEYELLLDVLNKVKLITDDLSLSRNIELESVLNYDDIDYSIDYSIFNRRKLYYKKEKDSEVIEFEYKTNEIEDILLLAEIYKQNPVVIKVANCNCQIFDNDKTTYVYEGDIFDTEDRYWTDMKSTTYVAFHNHFVKLIYVKGNGYLNDSGNLMYDNCRYNSHALTLSSWRKLGNLWTDLYLLKD